MKRYLKKEIKLAPTEDLNIRYCRILERAKFLDTGDIPVADAREILWIEDELRKRLIKQLGRDPYLPDRIEKKHPSNYMISMLKSNQPKPEVKPEVKLGSEIKFKITVTSSIGSKVAEKTIHVDSRSEADIQASKLIRDLGLKRATYKIS